MALELDRFNLFREQVRDWLAKNLPPHWRTRMLGATEAEHLAFQKEWFRKLKSGGYVAPHWPQVWGGAELSFAEQIILYEELARAGAPRLVVYFISLYHTPATLFEWGTDEQRRKYLPDILSGDVIWCQGFSEPGAGSDLAALRTRAERKGDHYVVNGQKIWSSNAQYAKYCLLLARTNPNVAKHSGISYFILDLESEGVTRKPIPMMTGGSHFAEIFFDDVLIPAENLIGGENDGWNVAQSTLSSERGLTILELTERMRMAFHRYLKPDALKPDPRGRRPFDDDEIRRKLIEIYARIEALRALVNGLLDRRLHDGSVGTEPSIIKVYYSELLQDFTEIGVRMSGLDGQMLRSELMGGGYETGNWMHDYLYSWSWTIAGGTNEIQRNVIAERGLGLPREQAPAKT